MSVRAWEHIDTQVLAGAAASVSFTPLSDEYRRWMLCVYAVMSVVDDAIAIRINNDSGGNYSTQELKAVSTVVSGSRDAARASILVNQNIESALVGQAMLIISKPTAGVVGRGTLQVSQMDNAATPAITLLTYAVEWTNTADLINRLDVLTNAGNNFAAGTRVVLFGARR